MQDNETRKWLYNSMKDKGYDLGSFEDFDAHADEEETRKWLYDNGVKSGLELGSYEEFDVGMGKKGNNPEGSVSNQVINEYDRSVRTDPVSRMRQLIDENNKEEKRRSLRQMAKDKQQQAAHPGNGRPTVQPATGYSDMARSERRNYAPEIPVPLKRDREKELEEKELDSSFKAKPVQSDKDILDNYMARFSNTKRGIELDTERAEIQAGIEAKYIEEFKNSPEYKEIAGKEYATQEEASEASKALSDAFYNKYGDAINNEMRPYMEVINDELFSRYGHDINEELLRLNKKDTAAQVGELAKEVDSLLDIRREMLRRRGGSGGNAMNALMGSARYNHDTEKERQETGALNSARKLLEQSQGIIAEAGKKGKTNFFAGLGRGFADNFNFDNFTFGLAEMADAAYLNNALGKAERGDKLTGAEEKLLEASVVNMATQAYFGSDLGRGYGAGKMTAVSLPFMLEFIVNPISSSGNAIAKSLLKYGLKKFGGKAPTKGAEFAGRLLGDAAAAAGMEGTTGAGRVAAGTLERLNADYDYSLDENGNLQVKKTGDTSPGNAFARSAASTFLENQSEMVFNAFKVWNPFMKAADKVLPGHVSEFMSRIKNSKPGRLYRELRDNPTFKEMVERAQFHGLPEEYMEEVYNNFANVAMGEMTMEEALDLDNNIDTFLGLAPTSAMFAAIGLGGMVHERAASKRRMAKIFGKFTDEQKRKFEELKRMSEEEGNSDIREFIKMTIADESLSQEEKRAKIEYAYELAKQNAMDDIRSEQPAGERAADDAYDEGTSLQPEQRYAAERERVSAGDALRAVDEGLADTIDRLVADDAGTGAVEDVLSGVEGEEKARLAREYYNASMRVAGVIDNARDEADEEVDAFEESIQPFVYEDGDGNRVVTTAVYGDNVDEEVHVVGNDGTYAAIIRPDGTKEMVAAGKLRDVQTRTADEAVQEYRDKVYAERKAQTEMSLENHAKTKPAEPGMVLWNGDNALIVDSVGEDGIVRAYPAALDGKTGQLSKKSGAAPVDMTMREAMELQNDYYNKMDEAESGEEALPGEKGANETSSTGVAPANVTTAKAQQGNGQSGSASNPNNALSEDKDIPPSSEKQADVIKLDEKGNPLYHKAPVEATLNDILDGSLTDDEVDGLVNANIKESESDLKKVSEKAPKIGTNKAKYLADKKAWQAKVDEAQEKVDYWKKVQDAVKESRVKPGDKTAEEILAMGEPIDGLELAARRLAGGNLPLLYEDYKRELGFGDKEAGKMFGLFKSRENGGLTIEEAGELLMQGDLEEGTNFFDQGDANAGRNAIIEVLSSTRTRGDLIEFIRKRREAMAERERNAEMEYEERERELWAQENFGMSYEDYVAYEEVIDDIIKEKAIPEEVIREFYDNFADELNNLNNGRIEEEATSDERQGDSGRSESGEGVLPTEQVDNTGGAETDTSTETDKRADNEGAPAQESTSGDEVSTGAVTLQEQIENARNDVDANPTDAQKEAGNYRKGHVRIDGYDITIENPKGSERSGTDANGNGWSVTMNNDYGYIRGTTGVDGDHIDVFLSDNPEQGDVFVVDQYNPDGSFDEHKVMYGFADSKAARDAYLSNYGDGWEQTRRIEITGVSKDEFKKWVQSSNRKTKPFADYKSVTPIEDKGVVGRSLTEAEATALISRMENMAVEAPQIELTPENWIEQFGEDGRVATPLGKVKLGDNQYIKLFSRNRAEYFGMMYPTLNSPDVVIEKKAPADGAERDTKLLFVKTFVKPNGSRIVHFESITVQRDGMEVSVSSHEAAAKDIKKDMQNGKILHISEKLSPDSEWSLTEAPTKPEEPDLVPTSDKISSNRQDKREGGEILILTQKGAAASLSTLPSDSSSEGKDSKQPGKKQEGKANIPPASMEETDGNGKTKPFGGDGNAKGYGTGNKIVSRERYDELKERMRKKMGGQMNMGIDPEILAIGTEMAVYHIEAGARKFAEYARNMIADLGDSIRPYLKSFYNGARELPEVQESGMGDEMTPYDEVRVFDVANFERDAVPNMMETAEMVVQEQKAQAQAKGAKDKLAKDRKKKRKTVSLQRNDLFNQNIEDNNGQQEEQGRRTDFGSERATGENRIVGEQEREENSGTELRGETGGVPGSDVPDTKRGRGVHGLSVEQPPVKKNQNNYSFGESHIDVPNGDVAKLRANIEAIRILKELEDSGNPATDEQKEKLAKYVGWVGLAEALNDEKYNARKSYYGADKNWNEKYLPYYEQLKELLTPEEFRSAVQSTTTSHYTPETVIRSLWKIAEKLGVKGGNVSEPALGTGRIIGFMPSGISSRSHISGYEIDSLSGRISKLLYPDADIKVQGYESEFLPQSKNLVITNVPFGKQAPYDKALDKTLKKKMKGAYNLHNYFIAKSLLELKEGGIGVFVTSSATMDGASSGFREFASSNGFDLIGAIRLPNDAFQKDAGTSVTADILVFRKRKIGEQPNGVKFISTTQIGEGNYQENGETRTKPIMVNEYFASNPEMMLGDMMTAHDAGSGGLYSGASQTLKAKPGVDLQQALDDAVDRLTEGIDVEAGNGNIETGNAEKEQTGLKNGTLSIKGGKVYVAMNGALEEIPAKETFVYSGKTRKTVDAVREYNELKSTLKELIAEEQKKNGNPEPLRKKLNEQYDGFVKKYGTLNRNKALEDVFDEDFEHNLPLSLETVKRVPSPTGKSMVYEVEKGKGILEKRVNYPVEEPTKADNIQDAVNISRSYRGVIDIPYIAMLTGKEENEVTEEMLDSRIAYRDPMTGILVDRDTYLSGNVKSKLDEARAMAESHPEFEKNVEDLAKVQPETIRFGDISYRLGTPWIPAQYVNEFAENVLGISGTDIRYMPSLNEFVVSKSAHVSDFSKSGLVRTERVGAIDLFAAALNQRKPKIYDEHTEYGPSGSTKVRTVNEAETQAAAEKIMEISDKFIEYIDGRKEIHRELERIYNDKYNNYVLKKYELPSFSHLEKGKDGKETVVTHYPNSNTSISMREHQARAVQRSLEGSTLLANQVGTGKTFTMITTAMEMRRLGIARKPMIVVQNATLEDFVKDFYKLYPGANVLAPGKNERSAENRTRLFNLIATGDFDAIVIPQSFMQFIPDDEGRKKELIQKRIDEYEEVLSNTDDYNLKRRIQKELDDMRDSLEGKEKGKKRSVKDKARAADRIKNRMERQLDRKTDDVMTFEQMGVDALFIDEAHNFKKIGFASKMNNVKGIDTGASQRANSLLLKARWVQEKNGGRNVVLATGTPITNTMAEVWTMMNFVSPEILEDYDIRNFDDFATTFGTVEPSLEFTATGNFKIADRFKSYVNVPELVKAFRSHTDVVLTEDVKEFKESNNVPKLKDGKMENVVIDKSEDLEDVMQILIDRLKKYNDMSGKEKKQWSALPLVVFTKAKQAAIDLRLLNPKYPDNPNSKTNQVVNNVLKLYKESTPDKGTQLIFCDSYQSPGEEPQMDLFDYDPDVPRFNLYEDIKKKLVDNGIPASEIAIVNNYDGERRKNLFEKVRNGDVRVLLGSTEKMGVGVNVQDRLFAVHHVAPIRPMDFEQRNGRILRQGNLYATWGKPVNVVTYGVRGTLDATAYDRLRIKQEFINQMMKGNVDGRVMEEQDDDNPSGMTFNQMAATLSGDKTAQLLFVAENKLKKLRNLKRSDANSKSGMADSIDAARNRITILENKKKIYEEASRIVDDYFPKGVESVSVGGDTFTDKIGVALDPVIAGYDDAYSLNRGTAPLKLSLNGGKAEVVVHFIEGRMVYELYAGKEHVVEGRQFNGGKGLMSSIDHQLKATTRNLSEVNDEIASQKEKIAGLQEAINAPWGREDELKEAEKEVDELRKKLEEQAKKNTKSGSEKRFSAENDKDFLTKDVFSMAENILEKQSQESYSIASKIASDFSQNHAGAGNSIVIRSRDLLRSQLESIGVSDENIRTILNTSHASAIYIKSIDKIIILNPNASEKEINGYLWHENTHRAIHEIYGDLAEDAIEPIYRWLDEKKHESCNHVRELCVVIKVLTDVNALVASDIWFTFTLCYCTNSIAVSPQRMLV